MYFNPFLSALQFLAWLLFQPTRWRNYCTILGVSADFNFTKSQWRSPDVGHLLLIILVILPLFVGGLVALGLYIIGRPWPNLIMGITYGMVITMAGGFFGAFIVSVAFAIVASLFSGLAMGLAHGEMAGLFILLGIIFAVSAAGSVLDSLTETDQTPPLVRQLGSIVLGIVVSALIFALGSVVTQFVAKWVWPILFEDVEFDALFVQLIGAVFALALTLGWFLFRRWRSAWALALGLTLLMGLLLEAVAMISLYKENTWIPIIGTAISVGAVHSLLFPILWTLPYWLVKRFANPLSGVIAGTLSSGGFYAAFLIYSEVYPANLLIPLCVISLLLGLTINSWRPLLFYPFVMAWHQVLLGVDDGRMNARLLRKHAAFWDEYQHLRLFGLDVYLVQVYEHNPDEGEAAIDYISRSAQSWAAKAAQIELDARRLEACETVQDIAQVQHQIIAGELLEQASSLLRTFNRHSQDVARALQYTETFYKRVALRDVQDALEKFFREITQTAHAVRFQPIVSQWRQVLEAYSKQLTSEIEIRHEIENPYITGNPLEAFQSTFVGRHVISREIEALLLKPGCPPLLLYGQRRMGKTSLLYNLKRLLPSTIMPLFVDVQGGLEQAENTVDFLYTLSRAMRRFCDLPLPPLTREALSVAPFSVFDEWLDEIEEAVAPAHLLLMLDEFTALDRVFRKNRLDKDNILSLLRHQIQHRFRFKILLCGSHVLEELLPDWANYLINVRTVHLSYLTEEEACQLIEQPVPQFALRYKKMARQRIVDLTRKHPALIQSLCHAIVELKNRQTIAKRRLVEVADVEAAVSRVLETSQFLFDQFKTDLDENGRGILWYLAAQGEGAVVSEMALAQHCPDGQWESVLSHLLRRELIEAMDNGYRFQVELIRRTFLK
jgi:hypothetical protein